MVPLPFPFLPWRLNSDSSSRVHALRGAELRFGVGVGQAGGHPPLRPRQTYLLLPPSHSKEEVAVDGQKVRPDPSLRPRNGAKRNFCNKFDGYEEFCDGDPCYGDL